jgi:uncharacterized protein (DUF1330 family)
MAAYLIASLKQVVDQAGFEQYGAQVGPTMRPYGGRLLAGGPGEHVEGDRRAKLTFIVEFPSTDALHRWYESEEYREPKALRLRSADFDLLFIDGA